jgi:hypothetical protein
VEVTGGTTTFTNDAFATTLYTGNATSQTITNNFDLSTNGGMIWFKSRTNTYNHVIFDTERWTSGDGNGLFPNADNAEGNINELTSFNTDGFGVTSSGYINDTNNMVAWSFKKQAKFFDIVTWTGNGVSGRTISHSLNSEVGFYVVKRLDASGDWRTYHRVSDSASNPHIAYLNGTSGGVFESDKLTATSTTFTIEGGFNGDFNSPNQTYVAYLFAHDTASDSRIKCGSYTGDGGAGTTEINLGWQPEFVMIKAAGAYADNWYMLDTTRGIGTDPNAANDAAVYSNLTNAETNVGVIDLTNAGFKTTLYSNANVSGRTYIYMAIRASAATDSAITWPSSVKWPSGVAPTTPASGTKDLFTFLTTDGGTTYYGKKAAEGLA